MADEPKTVPQPPVPPPGIDASTPAVPIPNPDHGGDPQVTPLAKEKQPGGRPPSAPLPTMKPQPE